MYIKTLFFLVWLFILLLEEGSLLTGNIHTCTVFFGEINK